MGNTSLIIDWRIPHCVDLNLYCICKTMSLNDTHIIKLNLLFSIYI